MLKIIITLQIGKAHLEVSTQKILVKFKTGIDFVDQKQILSNFQEIADIERENLLPAPIVTLVDLQNVSSTEEVYALLEKLETNDQVEYANHFLGHKDGTLHGVTDRFVVKLLSEAQFPIFENMMKFHPNVENFVRNEFDPLVMEIKVKGNRNALELANEFHEQNIFQFSEPDFYV